jgi:hypothetical protein
MNLKRNIYSVKITAIILKMMLAFLLPSGASAQAVVSPEIGVSGKGFPIFDEDSSPRAEDNTEFDVTTANDGQIKKVFVDAPQFSVSVLLQNSVSVDGVSSFEICYKLLTAGVYNATVTITSDDSDETYTQASN